MLKAKSQTWQTVEGKPSVVFRALDVRGKVVEMAVPLEIFILFANQAKTRLTTAEFANVKAASVGEWHHSLFHHVQTVTLGTIETTEPRRVGLILDRDLASELSLSLSSSDARELGKELVATADQVEQGGSPQRH